VSHDTAFFSFQKRRPPRRETPGVVATGRAAASWWGWCSAPPRRPRAASSRFLPFLMLVPFLFLMFRRNKKEAEQRSKLKKG